MIAKSKLTNMLVFHIIFRNRQTLSGKLSLYNYIRNLCHQLWQKFTRHEKLAKVNALRSELLFSVICFGAAHRKVRKDRKA